MCILFWVFEDKLVEKLVFGRSGLNSSVFEKLFISYSCISFIKQCSLRSFCIKMLYFSKFDFSRFSINRTCCLIDWEKFLVTICLARKIWNSIGKISKIFDWEKFQNFNWEKFEILGLESLRNWGFCSVGLKLMKLTCVIDWLCHYMMLSN